MGLKITVIMHPHGDFERVEEMRAAVAGLRARGHRVTPRLTFEGGDARRFAAAAARAHADLVIASGGDGTLNEVVNGLASSPWQPRLGIVPGGTANDFASGLQLPDDLGDAVEVAVRGRPMAMDVALVNRRYFINVSTGGFGAEASESTPADTKRVLGPLAYLITGVRKFAELRPAQARFSVDGKTLHRGKFMLFAVGNGRQTGGGSLLTARASAWDGKLDVLVVPALPRIDFVALLPDLRSGTHLNSPDVLYVQARSVTVDAAQELAVNTDGEPLRARRLRYRLRERPLSVMVP